MGTDELKRKWSATARSPERGGCTAIGVGAGGVANAATPATMVPGGPSCTHRAGPTRWEPWPHPGTAGLNCTAGGAAYCGLGPL